MARRRSPTCASRCPATATRCGACRSWSLRGIDVDVPGRQVTIGESQSSGAVLRVARDADGTLEMTRFVKTADRHGRRRRDLDAADPRSSRSTAWRSTSRIACRSRRARSRCAISRSRATDVSSAAGANVEGRAARPGRQAGPRRVHRYAGHAQSVRGRAGSSTLSALLAGRAEALRRARGQRRPHRRPARGEGAGGRRDAPTARRRARSVEGRRRDRRLRRARQADVLRPRALEVAFA